jgi:hypothetical protein
MSCYKGGLYPVSISGYLAILCPRETHRATLDTPVVLCMNSFVSKWQIALRKPLSSSPYKYPRI